MFFNSFCESAVCLTLYFQESKCLVMHPYKGELMMTQILKVAIKSDMDGGNAVGGRRDSEHSVPVIRLLYSFHSSGTEIKRLLGVAPTN